jgi:hypothetical protein
MRGLVMLVLCWPAMVLAEDWQPLDGAGIATALAARVLVYDGGALQDFFADGRTLYEDQWGHWEVRGDRYCSVWPPSDRWACYAVAIRGIDLRFTAEGGAETVGRYTDLQ